MEQAIIAVFTFFRSSRDVERRLQQKRILLQEKKTMINLLTLKLMADEESDGEDYNIYIMHKVTFRKANVDVLIE